jgi:thiamine pyrophosphate-dependent acetolactate synthase large subunit-like protein
MTKRAMNLTAAVDTIRRARRADDVVITTMGTAREWMTQGMQPRDLVFVPSAMGHAPSIGLGLALARPNLRVIVCNGDGSMLMNLGSLVTIAAANARNLTVIVFDNGVYEVTGAQPTPNSAADVDFAAIARGSGIRSVHRFGSNEEWERSAASIIQGAGPHVIALDVAPVLGKPGPKSPGNAAQRAAAFMRALAS